MDYLQQWNFGIQREVRSGPLVAASYVGTRGLQLFQATHIESVRTGGHGNSTRLRALGGSSTVITRPETSIRELVLGQQNVVCTEPVS